MKRLLITLLLIICSLISYSQHTIEWDGKYQIQLTDFQSKMTKIGAIDYSSVQSSITFDFSFQMSNTEFMFTKNFNNKVRCYMNRDAAFMIAPDTATAQIFVSFARYEFDMAELYARKFRKRMYESKGAFSDVNFCMPIYEEVHKDFSERHAKAWKSTNGASNEAMIHTLHQEVLGELAQLPDFCKTCKPQKKKKEKV